MDSAEKDCYIGTQKRKREDGLVSVYRASENVLSESKKWILLKPLIFYKKKDFKTCKQIIFFK